MFKERFKVLLRDKAGGPILRQFKNVFPKSLLERLTEWLSQLNNKDLVWDSTRNPFRLSTWIVAPPCTCRYTYAGQEWQPRKWTRLLEEVKTYTENALHLKSYFNAAVINVCIGGDGAVGMHADDEHLFNATSQPATIASISLGETRSFVVQNNISRETLAIDSRSGDLLTMDGLFQATHRHGVPKSRSAQGIRYNITFRRIVNHDHQCATSTSSSSFSETPVA